MLSIYEEFKQAMIMSTDVIKMLKPSRDRFPVAAPKLSFVARSMPHEAILLTTFEQSGHVTFNVRLGTRPPSK